MLCVGFFENQQIYQKCDETAHSLFTVRTCWWIRLRHSRIYIFPKVKHFGWSAFCYFVICLSLCKQRRTASKVFQASRRNFFLFLVCHSKELSFVSILFQIIKNFSNATIIKLVRKVFFKRELSWLSIIQTLPQFRFSQSDNRVQFFF
jgi:hypothetical protein